MDIEKLVAIRQKIYAARKEATKAYEAADAELEKQQTRVEAELLRFLTETNQKSARTDQGTVYRQLDTKPRVTNWSGLYEWIVENDAFEAIQKRVSKGFVDKYMEDNDGALPPGILVDKSYVLRIRSS